MAIIIPKKEIIIFDFNDFCKKFNLKTKKNAGENGTDEELIIEELKNIKSEKWMVHFTNNKYDGYFTLFLIE